MSPRPETPAPSAPTAPATPSPNRLPWGAPQLRSLPIGQTERRTVVPFRPDGTTTFGS